MRSRNPGWHAALDTSDARAGANPAPRWRTRDLDEAESRLSAGVS
jgi:hypothetical protein